ncbi:MAG: haloacid dehalogenase type II [Gemmatimonadota bacterium]|nr:MAG: haloacid dehalogenase type II [Gemmatimonadota bacterium]
MSWETISFDCYGTLVDWEAGIVEAFQRAAAEDGHQLDPRLIVSAYHEIEPQVQSAGTYRPYRAILEEAALQVAHRLSWELESGRAGFLAESLPDWPVFPDTRKALERLGDRYRLAVLSNIDDDLLAATLREIGVSFDWTVTAQQLRSYKPAPAHFREAIRRAGAGGARLIHTAQSWFHDIAPATQLGLAAVWVNRKGEPAGVGRRPLHTVAHLGELADWLTD